MNLKKKLISWIKSSSASINSRVNGIIVGSGIDFESDKLEMMRWGTTLVFAILIGVLLFRIVHHLSIDYEQKNK